MPLAPVNHPLITKASEIRRITFTLSIGKEEEGIKEELPGNKQACMMNHATSGLIPEARRNILERRRGHSALRLLLEYLRPFHQTP
jgi:hypothetical protein